jgi:hypothetical protein
VTNSRFSLGSCLCDRPTIRRYTSARIGVSSPLAFSATGGCSYALPLRAWS